MYPRNIILPNGNTCHCIFRCHNREMLFKPIEIKRAIVKLWAKYRKKYEIEIFDFIIMDNHCHLILKPSSAQKLGDFMRTVNSQISRIVNKRFGRDSQVIRERYKSPIITSQKYFVNCMQYIWTNRFKVDQASDPKRDIFCSASWKYNSKIWKLFLDENSSDKEVEDIRTLLSYPSDFGSLPQVKTRKKVVDLLNSAMSRLANFLPNVFEHGHTVGDKVVVSLRSQLLSPFSKGVMASERRILSADPWRD